MSRVAGLLLAAGGGRRIGVPKALLRLDSRLLVERAIATLGDGGCAPVCVVLGASADRIRAQANLSGVTVVVNSGWETGMGSSLKAGLRRLAGTDSEAVVVTLVDLPGLTAEAVRRVAALAQPQALVAATYTGRRSHPILLGRDHWPGISALAEADFGARPYLRAHAAEVHEVRCDDVADDTDIDTIEAAQVWGITMPHQRQGGQ